MKHARSKILSDAGDHLIAILIKEEYSTKYGQIMGTTSFIDQKSISEWCKYHIETGAVIYRASLNFITQFSGEKIPLWELEQLELAVTDVLEGVR